jgi:hypothetical protein
LPLELPAHVAQYPKPPVPVPVPVEEPWKDVLRCSKTHYSKEYATLLLTFILRVDYFRR